MRSVIARRISQGFFLTLFVLFCVVTSVGSSFWQLRGWPVNWFLELDPLAAAGAALGSRVLPGGLLWALVTVTVTLLFGRVFCGWLCPFGSMQQIVSWAGKRGKSVPDRIALNQYHPAQAVKYGILALLLAGAAAGLLQTGLLDPIPLAQRSVNLTVLALVDAPLGALSVDPRLYEGGALIGAIFLFFLLASMKVPRFFCRFVCPLGALLGLLSRTAPWRIGKVKHPCADCGLCDRDCEGACDPGGEIRTGECLMCMNCLEGCSVEKIMSYGGSAPAGGTVEAAGLSRRAFLTSVAAGLASVPLIRLSGRAGGNWDPSLIRPPGSRGEVEFLERCIKCAQCIRVCPTNVLQPAGLEKGGEALWTPKLNMRIGTSGCQLNCVACGNVCPTEAIRPLTLDEKQGRGAFKEDGPVRIGTAFVDRGRCLPWGMGRPCIVCEENCPLTPKAIHVEEEYQVVRDGARSVVSASANALKLSGSPLAPGKLATGDYFCALSRSAASRSRARRRIVGNTYDAITLDRGSRWRNAPGRGAGIEILVRLQKPKVDAERCTGCGVCEHECPVSGLRAIRVTAENESRSDEHLFTIRTKT